jgi:hypothetical protein
MRLSHSGDLLRKVSSGLQDLAHQYYFASLFHDPNQVRSLMSRLVIAAILAGLSGPVYAQGAPEANAMQLTVRPSGYERERNESWERQEKLLRRLEQSNHTVRSICINCGDEWKHQIYAPFNPLASLKPSAIPSDTTID